MANRSHSAPEDGGNERAEREKEEVTKEVSSAHVYKSIVSGGLIENINKMDLMSALQFLKLNEVPEGKTVYFVFVVNELLRILIDED